MNYEMNSSSCTKGAISPPPLWVAVCAHACICRWRGGVWHTVHGDRVPRFLPCRHLRQEAATHSRNVVQVTRETMHGATQSSSLRSRRRVCWQIPEPSAVSGWIPRAQIETHSGSQDEERGSFDAFISMCQNGFLRIREN